MNFTASAPLPMPPTPQIGSATARLACQTMRSATAVQVGTANYLNPAIAGEVADGIVAYAARHGFARVADLVGALEIPRR